MKLNKKITNKIRKPIQKRAIETSLSILSSAEGLMRKVPFEKISTTTIADKAGVGIGSLYEYFKNKEDLLVSVLNGVKERETQEFADLLSSIGDGPGKSNQDVLQEVIDKTIQLVANRLSAHNAAIRVLPRSLSANHRREIEEQLIEIIIKKLNRNEDPLDLEFRLRFISRVISETLISFSIDDKHSSDLNKVRDELVFLVRTYFTSKPINPKV